MKTILVGLACFSLSAHGSELWSASSGDYSAWSLVKYNNQGSGVLGNFNESDEGVDWGKLNDNSPTGLVGREEGFLRYALQSASSLAAYHEGTIRITYQDRYDTDLLPSVILLEGQDSEGNRMILSSAFGVSAGTTGVAEINIVSSSFTNVTEYYYMRSSRPGDVTMNFDTAPGLSEEEFAVFLSSVDNVMVRAFNALSDWVDLSTGGDARSDPYTFIYSIEITPIPEPGALSGLLFSSAFLAIRRKKRKRSAN